jgi:hypothetical protein
MLQRLPGREEGIGILKGRCSGEGTRAIGNLGIELTMDNRQWAMDNLRIEYCCRGWCLRHHIKMKYICKNIFPSVLFLTY